MKAKWKVWWIEPMPDAWEAGKKVLEDEGCEVILGRSQTEADRPYSEDEIIAFGKNVNAILLVAREKITARVFGALKDLRVVVKAGIGVDNIDVHSATVNGVLVANTPVPADYIGVAEGTVARILSLAKRLHDCDRNVKEGLWLEGYEKIRGTYLKGKTLGIVGFGRIGSYVTKLMAPWGMRILACDPYVTKEKATLQDVTLTDLETLLRESDVVTIHVIVTPETRKMIGLAQLKSMKRTSYLVNTARGAVIDEDALDRALREGWIAGAALDVFEHEPPSRNSHLLEPEVADKLLLSPHVSGLSAEMEQGLAIAQVEFCLTALKGKPPPSTLNPGAIPKWLEKFGYPVEGTKQ